MKKFYNEFKAFIMRGNVLDMAVGVIIATAFGKITTSLVNDVFMPFIGFILGGSNATEVLNFTVRAAVLDAEGNILQPATVIAFGSFLNTVIDFIIFAFIVFCIVKVFNKARSLSERKKAEEAVAAVVEAPAEPVPSKEELLLTEIRDLLKHRN